MGSLVPEWLGDSTAQSILIAEPLLADQERVLGADHPDTLVTRDNLAAPTRRRAARPRRSPCTNRTWPTEERVLGADHPDTLATRNNLANAYRDAGRTAEAITLHEQNLADQGAGAGRRPPRHPEHAQ